MVKSGTEKRRVGPGATPPPEGVSHVEVWPAPFTSGTAHVRFRLKAVPDVEVVLCLDEGRVVSMVVSGNISTRALRPIRLRELERYALAQLRHSAALAHSREYLKVKGEAEMARTLDRAAKQPANTSRERYLAALAADYVVLCAESGTPTKVLAEKRCMRVATVRDQLADARRRDLLLAAGPGRAGGELTPKAEALLSADEED